MSVSVHGLFPQPLVNNPLDLDLEKIIDFYNQKIYPERTEKNRSPLDQYLFHYGDSQDGKRSLFEEYSELLYIKDAITEAANEVYVDVLNYEGELEITDCWLNVAEKGASQPFHAHGNSVISGTFYANTDKNSNLTFESPYNQSPKFCNALVNYPSNKKNETYGFHHNYLTISVKSGDCLFWNSYLSHGYFNNETINRISLSFNMIPKKLRHFYSV